MLPSYSGADKKHYYSAPRRKVGSKASKLKYSEKDYLFSQDKLNVALEKLESAETSAFVGKNIIMHAKNIEGLDISGLDNISSMLDENKGNISKCIGVLDDAKQRINEWSSGTGLLDSLDMIVDKVPKSILATIAMGGVSVAEGFLSFAEFLPGAKGGAKNLVDDFYEGDIGQLIESHSLYYRQSTASTGFKMVGELIPWLAIGAEAKALSALPKGGQVIATKVKTLGKVISLTGASKDGVTNYVDLRERGYRKEEALITVSGYTAINVGLNKVMPAGEAESIGGSAVVKLTREGAKKVVEDTYLETSQKMVDNNMYPNSTNNYYSKDNYLIDKATQKEYQRYIKANSKQLQRNSIPKVPDTEFTKNLKKKGLIVDNPNNDYFFDNKNKNK